MKGIFKQYCFAIAIVVVLGVGAVQGAEYYASPSGSSTGSGAIGSPWDLQTALNKGYPANTVVAGDTIWLRNGTYAGLFTSYLAGTSGNPVKVRQYPGERATLQGPITYSQQNTLYIAGSYTWFMNFEVTAVGTDRISTQSTSWPTDIDYAYGVNTGNNAGEGVGCKLINLIVHDTSQALSLWVNAYDFETNGCVIYHNGWDAPDRGHGHGIYTQNQNTPVKLFKNNIIWAGFSYGTQAYGSENAYMDNFTFDNNTYFDAGIDSNVSGGSNLLLGGGRPSQNIVCTNNTTYRRQLEGDGIGVGYTWVASPNYNATVTGNYVVGSLRFVNWQTLTVQNNTTIGNSGLITLDITMLASLPPYTWNSNTYWCSEAQYQPFYYYTSGGNYGWFFPAWQSGTGLDSSSSYTHGLPTTLTTFVRASQYETGRGFITVYNWPQSSSVSVNVSSVLTNGDTYEVRDSQNFFGTPVTTGTYGGGSISIPMTGTTAAQPTGNAPLTYTHTSSQFGAFVLIKTGGGSPPAAPTNVAATDGTYTDKVTVSWTASTGATSYKVYRNTTNNSGTATQIGSPTGVTYDDTTATPGTSYYYWVKATNSYGDSGFSSSNTGWRALSAPTGVAATDGTYADKVRITWTASTGATAYKAYRNTTNNSGTATLLGSVSASPYDDTTATAGTTYYYWVKASCALGDSAFSAVDTGYRLAPPAAPTSLAATDGTYANKVTISWTASSGATSYKVFRNTTNNSGTATQIGTPAASPYDDTTAAVGTTYYYWAKATNLAGDSGFSNSDTGYRMNVPAAPTSLAATDGTYTDKVTVSWTASSGATSYKVFRNTTNNSGTATQIGSPTASPYDDTTATAGTTYYYWAKATNAAGDSGFSNSDTGYRALPPTFVQYMEAESGNIISPMTTVADGTASGGYLIWTTTAESGSALFTINAPSAGDYVVWGRVYCPNNGGSNDSYYVKVDSGAEDVYDMAEGIWGSYWQWTKVNGRNGTGVPNTLNPRIFTLTAGNHTFTFRGREVQSKLDRLCFTNNLSYVPVDPPAAPTALAATDGTYTDKVRVSWTASSGATSYKVFRNTTNNSGTATQIGTPTASPYDDTTATAGTTYYYWAKAVNASGDSDFSNSDTGYRSASFTVTITYVSTGKTYVVTNSAVGTALYIDRAYTVSSLSSTLTNKNMIQTSNDDKAVTAATHLTFTISAAATVYVCYDSGYTAQPAWLASGWTQTSETFQSSDGDSNQGYRVVFSKSFSAGSVTLGGNMQSPAAGVDIHYSVVIVPN